MGIRNDRFSDSGTPDANRRARGLMCKLINKTDVTLKSLSITNVKIGLHHGIGQLARIFQGEYKGEQIALKMSSQSPILRPDSFNKFSCQKDPCRQSLVPDVQRMVRFGRLSEYTNRIISMH